MRIVDVECLIVWCPERGINFTLVVVETDEGLTGVGEAGLTGNELAVSGAIEHLKPVLIGQDPTRIEHLWQTMFRGSFFPAQGAQSAAISAIDVALWDIRGKALGVPVYDLLGGRVRDSVECYPHNYAADETGRDPVAALVESCRRTTADGWRFVRWGVGYDWNVMEPRATVRQGVEQVEAVRAALGVEIEICLDVHTRLDVSDAIAFCLAVEPLRPFFVEDPIRAENPDAFRTLRARTAAPLAAGEQFTSKWEFQPLVEAEWIDYARVDLGLVGGPTEARKVAAACETHYIRIAPHCPIGPVATAACLHLDLATPNFGVQELPVRPNTLMPDVFQMGFTWDAGSLWPSTKPGLGIEVDQDAARRYPFRPARIGQSRRRDGAFVNP